MIAYTSVDARPVAQIADLPTQIDTKRLRLRPLDISDARAFAEGANDPAVATMTGSFALPYLTLSAEFFILRQPSLERRNLARHWVITQEGKLIGCMGLTRADTQTPFEIGYWIARSAWGQGYMNEAMTGVMDAVRNAGMAELSARVFTDNPASRHLLEKQGFTITHVVPGHSMSRQGVQDGWHMIWFND